MPESDKIIEESIMTAIGLEREGLRIYLEFARKTGDMTGKNMFILLATDEFHHMNILEDNLKYYKKEGSWKKPELPDSIIMKVLPKIEDIDNLPSGEQGINQMEALDMAMKSEEKSRDLYSDLAEKCKDKQARFMFQYLADMEQSHWEILNTQRNNIAGTGFWAEIDELTMDALL